MHTFRTSWTALIAAALASLSLTSPTAADDHSAAPVTPHQVPRLEHEITIDGVLEESEWGNALVLELPYETNPGDNVEPPVRTEVLLTYDEGTLFAAFRCHDPDPAAIQAHLTDREDCFDDDHVNIHLDTFNDERRHYTIGANPLGVQMDAVAEGGSFDWSWDSIFDAAGRLHQWGYAVEIAIPFNQLRFQRTDGPQIWGFDAWRVYPRSLQHFMAVVPNDRDNDSHQSQMIKIEGFDGVRPGKNLEINPTLTTVHTEARDLPDGDFATTNSATEAGLTVSWGMTPSIGLSATINPDFSQVEADARQLDIDQPFALYFNEKRPFFLEGTDFFDSPLVNAIHTRTLRDPEWGAKIAGKEGANGIGAFFVRDSVTNLLFPGSESSDTTSLAASSLASVARYTRDIGDRVTVGAILTDRESDTYFNRVLGVDGEIRLSDSDRLKVQFVGSSTRYSDDVAQEFSQPEGEFRDRAFDVTYSHTSGTWYWWASTENYGEDFRADLGFVPKVDYRIYKGALGRDWRPEGEITWFSRIRFEGMVQYEEDQRGNLLTNRADLFALYEGPMQSVAAARLFQAEMAYNGQIFDVTYFGTYTGFRPRPNILIGLDTSFGDKIDYANTRLGKRIRLQPELSWSLGDHFSFLVDHQYERLDVESQQLYRATVSQGTFSYQFTINAMVRATMQYVDYRYNADLYTFEAPTDFKSFFSQFLFSYKINPRTMLFVGYSDNYQGGPEYPLTQGDRTIFGKVGYAWQL